MLLKMVTFDTFGGRGGEKERTQEKKKKKTSTTNEPSGAGTRMKL